MPAGLTIVTASSVPLSEGGDRTRVLVRGNLNAETVVVNTRMAVKSGGGFISSNSLGTASDGEAQKKGKP